MRPRINSKFGTISFEELFSHLKNNCVQGTVVKRLDNSNIYKFLIMFRSTRNRPESLCVEVSRKSKMVLGAWTDKIKFETKKQLLNYTTL